MLLLCVGGISFWCALRRLLTDFFCWLLGFQSVTEMSCCSRNVKNPKHFANCVLRKGKSKYANCEVCLCLQYICIAALYQIVMVALFCKFKVLKERVDAVKKKVKEKFKEEDSKAVQFTLDKKLECLKKEFLSSYFSSCDAGEVPVMQLKKFQGKLAYTLYFKYLVLKSGDADTKKQASVSDSTAVVGKKDGKVAAVAGSKKKVGTGAVGKDDDKDHEHSGVDQDSGKKVLDTSTVAEVAGKKEANNGSQSIVEPQANMAASIASTGSIAIERTFVWTELCEDFNSLSALVVDLSVLCGNFKQKMAGHSKNIEKSGVNVPADQKVVVNSSGTEGVVQGSASVGAPVGLDQDQDDVDVVIMLNQDTTAVAAEVGPTGQFVGSGNKVPVPATVKIEKEDKPAAAKKTTNKKKAASTHLSPGRSGKKAKRN
jgi:hypothetical protein